MSESNGPVSVVMSERSEKFLYEEILRLAERKPVLFVLDSNEPALSIEDARIGPMLDDSTPDEDNYGPFIRNVRGVRLKDKEEGDDGEVMAYSPYICELHAIGVAWGKDGDVVKFFAWDEIEEILV